MNNEEPVALYLNSRQYGQWNGCTCEYSKLIVCKYAHFPTRTRLLYRIPNKLDGLDGIQIVCNKYIVAAV